MNKIFQAANAIRESIDSIYMQLGITFESFPRGACGDATLILGTYFIDQGFSEFNYMLGDYGSHEDDTWSSHAWLQNGDLVVDITADQFPEISEKVIVSRDSSWHRALKGNAENVANFRIYDQNTVANFQRIYSKVVAEIVTT